MVPRDAKNRTARKTRLQVSGAVQLSVVLVPGTDEFRAYNRIKRKYLAEVNARQLNASDDEICKVEVANCAIVRGSLFALDEVPQEHLPEYLDAAWKPKGRPAVRPPVHDIDKSESDTQPEEQATLLH